MFAEDMRTVADTLGIDKMAVVGLSGGGPYTLACAAKMPERVVVAGVVGGVAPACGPDRIGGGLMALGSRVAPLLEVAGAPIRLKALTFGPAHSSGGRPRCRSVRPGVSAG